MQSNAEVVLSAIRAVEERDREALFELYHQDVEFHDAPSLPYGGSSAARQRYGSSWRRRRRRRGLEPGVRCSQRRRRDGWTRESSLPRASTSPSYTPSAP